MSQEPSSVEPWNQLPFAPDYTSPPGATILDLMLTREVDPIHLAKALCLSPANFAKLLDGDVPLTLAMAEVLAQHLGGSVEFWLKREADYRMDLERFKAASPGLAFLRYCRQNDPFLQIGGLLCHYDPAKTATPLRLLLPNGTQGTDLTLAQLEQLSLWLQAKQAQAPPRWDNPYLEKFEEYRQSLPDPDGNERIRLTRTWSWAIPCDEALDALQMLAPLIEIGAGKGYWASLLQRKAVTIIPMDCSPPGAMGFNAYCEGKAFTRILCGKAEITVNYPDHTLFLCWPPEADSMAYDALRFYQGQTVAYCGDQQGGCTASDAFFDLLKQAFQLIRVIDIPRFPGLQDALCIYKRIPSPSTKKQKR